MVFASCQSAPEVFNPLPREAFVGYQRTADILRVVRLLAVGGRYELHQSVIVKRRGRGAAAGAGQSRDSVVVVQARLQKQYQWRPYVTSDPQVLFVQADSASDHRQETWFNIMAIMHERCTIEDAIDDQLQSQHLGSWSAGDLGPGGMNMLFDVTNPAATLPVAVRTLETERMQHRACVARRLMTAPNDWCYEVVYPLNYTEVSNSM